MLLAAVGFPEGGASRVVEQTRRAIEQDPAGLAPPEEVFRTIVRLRISLLQARAHRQAWRPAGW